MNKIDTIQLISRVFSSNVLPEPKLELSFFGCKKYYATDLIFSVLLFHFFGSNFGSGSCFLKDSRRIWSQQVHRNRKNVKRPKKYS